MRSFIAALKIFLFLISCLVTIPLQALGGLLLGNNKLFYIVPTLFYSSLCLIFRISIRLKGHPADGHVVYVGNHLSYIDIAAIGAKLNATFISKEEVRSWPVLGILATLGKTVFIERTRNAATKCIADIKKTLSNGRNLILFPEGTSTNGMNVLPFKSTLFELFLNQELKDKLKIQPFTITLLKTNTHAITKESDYDLYAWYGDMKFFPHLWELAKSKGAEILITYHPARHAADYNDRKAFAHDCHKDTLEGLKNTLPPTLDFKAEAA